MADREGPSPWRWVIVFASFFLSFITDGVRFSFGLTYKELLEEFDAGKGPTAGIGSLMFAMMNFTAPVASILVNKYGCRFTVMLGSTLYCVGLVATSLTPNFYFLYFSFGIICGIGYSMMYVPTSVIILQYFDKKKSFANGIAMCGSGVGGFIFNPLINSLFAIYNWRGALLVASGIVLHGAIAGTLLRPYDHPKTRTDDTDALNKVEEDCENVKLIDNNTTTTNSLSLNSLQKDCDKISNEMSLDYKHSMSENKTEFIIADTENTDSKSYQISSSNELGGLDKLSVDVVNIEYQDKDDRRLPVIRHNEIKNKNISSFDTLSSETKAENNQTALNLRQYRSDNYQINISVLSCKTYNNKDTYRFSSVDHIRKSQTTSKSEIELNGEADNLVTKVSQNDGKNIGRNVPKKRLFAWYLLKDPKFIMFMSSQFFLAVAYMIPFTYLPEFVMGLGYSRPKAVWLMSSISIVSTVSRVCSGWLADKKFVNRRLLYCAALFMGAASVSSLFLWRSYWLIVGACVVYGMSTGCIIATIAIMVLDLFGSRVLSDAYGLSVFSRTPGNLAGPPFSGWIVDETGRLDLVFLVSGAAFAVSGISATMSVRAKTRLNLEHDSES